MTYINYYSKHTEVIQVKNKIRRVQSSVTENTLKRLLTDGKQRRAKNLDILLRR